MPVNFDAIQIGAQYDRPQLAELWGYEDYHAIARGAVTPAGTQFIILFITREKQVQQTQYEDHLENGILDIEGETNHVADARIINAAGQAHQIHLFYRDRHHMSFTYYGQIHLSRHERHEDSPSRFTFRVPSEQPDAILETELVTHGQIPDEYVPSPEGRRVMRLHVAYERSPRNRRQALEIHGGNCMACGFSFDNVYGNDHARGYIEIHHVNSLALQQGRPVNPATDLVPLCSNCHSMAHRQSGRTLTVQQIQAMIRQ